jgi:hypothetical protein
MELCCAAPGFRCVKHTCPTWAFRARVENALTPQVPYACQEVDCRISTGRPTRSEYSGLVTAPARPWTFKTRYQRNLDCRVTYHIQIREPGLSFGAMGND